MRPCSSLEAATRVARASRETGRSLFVRSVVVVGLASEVGLSNVLVQH